MAETGDTLHGRLLLAMPTLTDPNFRGSVILMCEHNDEGALGLVINHPLDLTLGTVLKQLQLPGDRPGLAEHRVFSGGPVENERGFVIHDAPERYAGSVTVSTSLAVTSSQEILAEISRGEGPTRFMMVLGYAGWGPGQLEHELGANAWLAAPASPDLVFETAAEHCWREAAARIGVDPIRLSGEAGHA